MLAMTLTPAALSLLVLAAHFLRRGRVIECAVVIGLLLTLLAVRRPWVPRATQFVLAMATLLWAWTLAEMVRQRQDDGAPAGRLVVILGSVIAVNVLGAFLLGSAKVTRRYADRA